jgi:hypothetical protein
MRMRKTVSGEKGHRVIGSLALVLAWHLLMPPLAAHKTQHRFVWISDAPIREWYHKGEYKTLGDCHNARAEKIIEQQKKLTDLGKESDFGDFAKVTLESLEHARCLSDQDIK